MSRYYTDFSEYPSNAAPTDWMHIWETGNTWEVRDQTGAVGGKVLYDSSPTAIPQCFGWITPGSALTDCEVLVKLQTSRTASVCLRASNPGSPQGYYAALASDGYVYLRRRDGNYFYVLSRVAYSWQTSQWYWIRFRIDGTTLRVRWWRDGESEPATWGIEVTNAVYASGYAGVGSELVLVSSKFDIVGVGTNGDSAPSPPLAATFADSVAIAETLAKSARRRLTEVLSLVTSELVKIRKAIGDCVDLTDTTTAARVLGMLLVEAATLSDLVRRLTRRRISEMAQVVDRIAKRTHRPVLDAVFSADRAVRKVQRSFVDAVVTADAVITQLARVLVEAAPVTELLGKRTNRSCHDAVAPADILTKHIEKTVGDAILLFENARHTVGRYLHETLVLADVITRGAAKACREGLALAENAFTRGLRKVLRLAILLADTQRHKVGKPVSDSLAFADANTRRPGKRLVEPLVVGESPRRRIGRALFEVVTFADKLRRGYRVALASILLFADEVLISWRKSRLIRETVSLVEGFHDAWLARARSLPAEAVKRAIPVFTDVFQDAVLLVEGFTTKFRRSDRQ